MAAGRRLGRLSIQTRLTVWYGVVLAAVLGVTGAVAHLVLDRLSLDRFDDGLSRSSTLTVDMVRVELEDELVLAIAIDETLDDLGFPGQVVTIVDEAGRVLGSRGEGPDLTALVDPTDVVGRPPRTDTVTVATRDQRWRVHVEAATHLGASFTVLVGASLAPIETALDELRRILLVGVPVAWLLGMAGGRAIARRGLAPLTRLASDARRLRHGRADLRLNDPHTGDELSTLAQEFNLLLARLDTLIKDQRRFMADASHELRTPVSVIRNAADVTLGREGRSSAEYAESMRIVGEQAARLGRIVDDLFLLARADAHGQPLRITRFYLDEVVGECVRGVQVLDAGRERPITVSVERDVEIEADEDLVRRLVANVLENAVRHAATAVSVTLSRTDGWAELLVSNDGPSIALHDRERIFERFVRLDPARGVTGSAGLGLPIARWVAEAHGGTLELADLDSPAAAGAAGAAFRVRLRLAR